jgi:hypothetical protein
MINFNIGCRFILFPKANNTKSSMADAKSLNVVFQRPLVLKIRPTSTIPNLPTVLLMGSPITFNCKCLATFPTHEGFGPMLSLVMCLEGSKIFERPCSWVLDVVLAPWCAAVAWQF